jgi:hypothetical protein
MSQGGFDLKYWRFVIPNGKSLTTYSESTYQHEGTG